MNKKTVNVKFDLQRIVYMYVIVAKVNNYTKT
jgi:hypothetical protein